MRCFELCERDCHSITADAVPRRHIAHHERRVSSGVTGNQLEHRCVDRVGEGLWQAEWKRASERIAVTPSVFGGDKASFSGDGNLDGASLAHQQLDECRRVTVDSQREVGEREVTHTSQHVVHFVCSARTTQLSHMLQLKFDIDEHVTIEQFAQLFRAEQVVEQVAVERERRSTALGERGVTFIHIRRDPVEEQALGER